MGCNTVSMTATRGFSGLGTVEPVNGVCPDGYYEFHKSDCVEGCIPNGVSTPALAFFPKCTRDSSGVLRPSATVATAVPSAKKCMRSHIETRTVDPCAGLLPVPYQAGVLKGLGGTTTPFDDYNNCRSKTPPTHKEVVVCDQYEGGGGAGMTPVGWTSPVAAPGWLTESMFWKYVAAGTGVLALVLLLRK